MSAPTARVRHGAGCSLPTYRTDPATGARVRSTISASVPIRLRFSHMEGTSTDDTAEVWVVPAEHFGPGAVVELDPLPPGVVVRYEIPRPAVIHRPLAQLDDSVDDGAGLVR